MQRDYTATYVLQLQGRQTCNADYGYQAHMRLGLGGTRQVILFDMHSLMTYLQKLLGTPLINPRSCYDWFKSASPEKVATYVQADNKVYNITCGPCDFLYTPFGYGYFENIGVGKNYLSVRWPFMAKADLERMDELKKSLASCQRRPPTLTSAVDFITLA